MQLREVIVDSKVESNHLTLILLFDYLTHGRYLPIGLQVVQLQKESRYPGGRHTTHCIKFTIQRGIIRKFLPSQIDVVALSGIGEKRTNVSHCLLLPILETSLELFALNNNLARSYKIDFSRALFR